VKIIVTGGAGFIGLAPDGSYRLERIGAFW
jgi:nucleoside-diphosphate-sugar epimerase